MTREEFSDYMDIVFTSIQQLREAGQKEYAHEEDNCFANFERIAKYLGLDREQVLSTYLIKHIDGITAYVRGHRSQRESVTGRIDDAIVYLFLLRGMIDDEQIPNVVHNLVGSSISGIGSFRLDQRGKTAGSFRGYAGHGVGGDASNPDSGENEDRTRTS